MVTQSVVDCLAPEPAEFVAVLHGITRRNKMLDRAQDPRANGAWLSKLTE